MQLRRLTVETLEEFLNFFDHRAFLDNPQWSGCYCQFYLGTEDQDLPIEQKKKINRDLACSKVATGDMDGYLLMDKEKVIGWCAAGSSLLYPSVPDASEQLARILCFNIDPDLRGQNLASQLLEMVVADLKSRGFEAVEAAPSNGEVFHPRPYRGILSMFVNRGFEPVANLGGGFTLVRKYLT